MVKTSRHLEEWASPRTVITLTMLFVVVLWAAVGFWVVSARHERMLTTSESLQRMNHAVEDQTRRQFRLVNVFLATSAQWLEANPGRDARTDPAFRKLIAGFRSAAGVTTNDSHPGRASFFGNAASAPHQAAPPE